MGSSPPLGIRLGTGAEGANRDNALASSGIFPAGQMDRSVKEVAGLSVSSMPAQLAHWILERKRE